jgi:hypothetical protein
LKGTTGVSLTNIQRMNVGQKNLAIPVVNRKPQK